MKYLLVFGLVLFLSSGCVLTKALIPDVQTRMSNNELTHKAAIATATQSELSKITFDNDRGKLNKAKLIYKTGVNADDIAPSAIENLAQQYVRGQGQGVLDKQLNAGFEWTTRTLTEVAGGVTGTGGVAALILGYLRKKKALGIVGAELSPDEKTKVKKAMNHTGLEKQLS